MWWQRQQQHLLLRKRQSGYCETAGKWRSAAAMYINTLSILVIVVNVTLTSRARRQLPTHLSQPLDLHSCIPIFLSFSPSFSGAAFPSRRNPPSLPPPSSLSLPLTLSTSSRGLYHSGFHFPFLSRPLSYPPPSLSQCPCSIVCVLYFQWS